MITELKKNDFHKCVALVNEEGHMEVEAVIEGNNPGRIFVDNLEYPDAALLWLGNNDGFFLMGNEQNKVFLKHLDRFIEEVIFPDARKQGLADIEIMGHHPKWDPVIEKLFKNRKRKLESGNQFVFHFLPTNDLREEPILEQVYQTRKINKALYNNENNEIENVDFLRSNIKEYWSSPDDFFEKGLGYCIIHNGQIVSFCFAGFVAGDLQCINIETLKEHQGKKLAQKVAHHFVKECQKRGMLPYWDCMEVNHPSAAVAERVGFTKVFEYKVYEFPIA
ncbi:GNAT family N-acetyltransferase [Gracilibacillus kekensis]|uniref:GNAT acetyltransferase n=1 Tax=Gracilibacillus kekensis TaxID=1027249 RepID=A0A1M7IU50_9BACI|nr:GNAT family N-acetyltransferase [Gracilibacillus kekensis]SHM44225.1 GNAT acetyltransferase [Gracilibacillus kekensis]